MSTWAKLGNGDSVEHPNRGSPKGFDFKGPGKEEKGLKGEALLPKGRQVDWATQAMAPRRGSQAGPSIKGGDAPAASVPSKGGEGKKAPWQRYVDLQEQCAPEEAWRAAVAIGQVS